MAKDVVFLIIDSLCQHNVGTGFSGETVTPFLDSIRNECIVCSKAYSQGPYTEAGTKSLLCGEDTLSSGGYLLRYANSPTFITDEFYDNGYETFCYMYPTALLSTDTLAKTDHMIYTSGFDFPVIWKQKLSYYAQKRKQQVLDEYDVQQCVKIMELSLASWTAFLNPENPEEAYRIIQGCVNSYDLEKNRKLLALQVDLFRQNKERYVNNLLKEGAQHKLFRIDGFEASSIIHKESVNAAFAVANTLESKFEKKQIKYNRKNNKYPWKNQLRDLCEFARTGNKYSIGKMYNYYSLLRESKDMRICRTQNDYKCICSAKTTMDDARNVLSTHTEKPKFIFIHVEDTHYFSTFFTYDSGDVDQISQELFDAENYIDGVSSLYRGNLMYDLSIRYVDKQVENLFKTIKKNGNMDKTLVCITADHGYSYNRFPLRDRLVNNFHEENYHIPVYIYAGKEYKQDYCHFMLGKDIVATIYDLCNFDLPGGVTGQSILSAENKRDYVIIEYMGPGCPDMRNREAWICARNDKRMVAVKAELSLHSLGTQKIVEAYNLEADPLEETPMNDLDAECIKLFNYIAERWQILKSENGL